MRLSSRFSRRSRALRANSVGRVVIAVACVGWVGCQVSDDARLLTLRGVDSSEVVLGEPLVVRGDGFPTGAACTVDLRGELSQAGVAPRSIEVSLPGRAVSRDEVLANVMASALPVIDAHATFHGKLSLRFSAAAGVSQVSGEIDPVDFDLLRAEVDLSRRHAQLRRARSTLGLLGIVLEDESENGLRVRWAREQSVAALAGLRQGDVLTHLAGLRLRTAADLAPAPGASHVRLRVRPSTNAGERVVMLSLASAQQPELGYSGRLLSAVAVLVLVCLVWLAPIPRRLVRFRSERAPSTVDAPQRARASSGGSSGALTRLFGRSIQLVVLWPLAASLVWVALAVGERWQVSWQLLSIAAVIAAAHLVTTALAGRRGSSARVLALDVGGLLIALSPLVCAGLIGGSATLTGIVEEQGALPWQWFVFRAPPLLLACVVFVSGARRLIDRSTLQGGSMAFAIAFAGIGSAVFLGGWRPIDLGLPQLLDPAVVGIVLFAAKAWALMLLLTLPRQPDVAMFSTPTWLALSLVSVALSLVWIRLPIVATVQLVVGHSLCGATFAVAALQLWRWQRPPPLRLQ